MEYIEPFTDFNDISHLTEKVIGETRQSIKDNHDKIVALLKELTSHYNTGNRSIEGISCRYKNDAGNMCAVGRCLTEEALNDFNIYERTERTFGITVLPTVITDKYSDFDSMFQEKYQGIHEQVWGFMQGLHDDENWDENGLNDEGAMAILNTLGTKIHNDVFGK
jgi:hypothetical protein